MPFSRMMQFCSANADSGRLVRTELGKLKQWCADLDKEKKFTDMILIGIGGSDLGPRAMYLGLQVQNNPRHCRG